MSVFRECALPSAVHMNLWCILPEIRQLVTTDALRMCVRGRVGPFEVVCTSVWELKCKLEIVCHN